MRHLPFRWMKGAALALAVATSAPALAQSPVDVGKQPPITILINASRGPVALQMLAYGAIFAVLTTLTFTLLGSFAAQLSAWLQRRPRAGAGLNTGAGLTFIAAGLSILALPGRAR